MYKTSVVVLGNLHCFKSYRKNAITFKYVIKSLLNSEKQFFGWREFGFEVPGREGDRDPLKWVCNF